MAGRGLVARVVAALPLVGRGWENMEALPTLCSSTTCSWLARALVVWEPASSKLCRILHCIIIYLNSTLN